MIIDTPNKLKRALYQRMAMNAIAGKPVVDMPKDIGWDVAELCAYAGCQVKFVLTKTENLGEDS